MVHLSISQRNIPEPKTKILCQINHCLEFPYVVFLSIFFFFKRARGFCKGRQITHVVRNYSVKRKHTAVLVEMLICSHSWNYNKTRPEQKRTMEKIKQVSFLWNSITFCLQRTGNWNYKHTHLLELYIFSSANFSNFFFASVVAVAAAILNRVPYYPRLVTLPLSESSSFRFFKTWGKIF